MTDHPRTLRIGYRPRDGQAVWVAFSDDLEGLEATGETPEEADVRLLARAEAIIAERYGKRVVAVLVKFGGDGSASHPQVVKYASVHAFEVPCSIMMMRPCP